MKIATNPQEFTSFSPNLTAEDKCANYWIHQVTIRLRREICWRWQQQEGANSSIFPPISDPLTTSLDLSRYWPEKERFFQTDLTAKYLTDKLNTPPPIKEDTIPGSMSWAITTLNLDDISAFILALGLIVVFDQAAGAVIAACLNAPTTNEPNLALAQQLWDNPEQILTIADPSHPLWSYGLLQLDNTSSVSGGISWHTPLIVPPLVATCLLFPESSLPQALVLLNESKIKTLSDRNRFLALRLAKQESTLRIAPILSAKGACDPAMVQSIAQVTQRKVIKLRDNTTLLENNPYLKSLVTLCWLRGFDLFLRDDQISFLGNPAQAVSSALLPLQSIPITIFLRISSRSILNHFSDHLLLPIIDIPRLSVSDRLLCWQEELGTDPTLTKSIAECSRRFRYESETIRAICTGLKDIPQPLTEADLFAACRAELEFDIGQLAEEVLPRFRNEELVLPKKQHWQFEEIYQAMKSLTEVHYVWGTAKVWNECGISVLFTGPPGTGKTMGAEILASRLHLPMYRIDLSQVVNKYIGETEKNLKRLFDAADISDTILFFDEADALFGRRTEVKDAHDRYANLEISYLLERMERFKGLAILATNRKKDLDEAFLRRLRYIVDFPMPDLPERRRIWHQVIPEKVEKSQLDFEFLARQFPLAGGHIRSIVFNACLQAATGQTDSIPKLTMEQVIVAIKREYDKLNRSVSLEQFGAYAKLIEEIDRD